MFVLVFIPSAMIGYTTLAAIESRASGLSPISDPVDDIIHRINLFN